MIIKFWDRLNASELEAEEVALTCYPGDDRRRLVAHFLETWAEDQHDYWNDGCESIEVCVRFPDQDEVSVFRVELEHMPTYHASFVK